MNRKILILFAIALLASACDAAGKQKGKHSKESKESNESSKSASKESREDSDQSASKEVEVTEEPTTAATEEPTEAGTTVEPEIPTDPAITTEPATAEPVPEPVAPVEASDADLKAQCKGERLGLKPYPGNCSKYVICALGRVAGTSKCVDTKNLNSLLGICAC